MARVDKLAGKVLATPAELRQLAEQFDYYIQRGLPDFEDLRQDLADVQQGLDKHSAAIGELWGVADKQRPQLSLASLADLLAGEERRQAVIEGLEALASGLESDWAEIESDIAAMRRKARRLAARPVATRASLSLLRPDWEGSGKAEREAADREAELEKDRERWDPDFLRARLIERTKGKDPGDSPRYFDNLEIVDWTHYPLNGATELTLIFDGQVQRLVIPADRMVVKGPPGGFRNLLTLHATEHEAMATVNKFKTRFKGTHVYAFYVHPSGMILPTSYSAASSPKFHKADFSRISEANSEQRNEVREALLPLANVTNPIPGTTVDEHGQVSASGNPLDWTGLLKLRRLKKIKAAGPITTRYHSGGGVPYAVTGPHGNLSKISVYVLRRADGTALYVGKGNTLARLREHVTDSTKTGWFGEIATIEVRATKLENWQALALEESLIGELNTLGTLYNKDLHPFGMRGDADANLPKAQRPMYFHLEWGHGR